MPSWIIGLSIIVFWVSPNSYNHRPELFNIFLIIINFILLHKFFTKKNVLFLIGSALLTSIIGLVHPVAGVFTVLATSIFFIDKKLSFTRYMVWGAVLALILCIIYLPISLIDIDHWIKYFFEKNIVEDNHTFNPELVLKYILYNPLLFALYISIIPFWTKKNLFKELFFLFIITLVLALFGRSYYYPYLGIFMIWRISELTFDHYKVPALIILILIISPVYTHYLPTFQQLENNEYSRKFRSILSEVKGYRNIADTQQVWLPSSICMPIIDKSGARLHYNFYYLIAPSRIALNEGDKILVTSQSEINYIYRNIVHEKDDLEINNVIPESDKGLLSASFSLNKRSTPIGLWEITLKKNALPDSQSPTIHVVDN